MPTEEVKQVEYRSMEEYRKHFFPESYKKEILKEDDPRTFGVNLARESLKKIKQLMPKK